VAWEGLSHAEAGAVLGVSPNAAAIRLHRARRRLAATMKGSPPRRTWTGWKGSVTDVERGEEV
jgi:DNA-directed RNA polymerase specialized sigma24 family protein